MGGESCVVVVMSAEGPPGRLGISAGVFYHAGL